MTESKSKVSTPPILIGHLPRAEAEARKAFSEIQNNTYEKKSLGKQQQVEEVFPCDCHYEPGQELNSYTACGEHADCINRLTQTECTEVECRSKSYCQNQRFQRKQYAPLEIVQTEHKGFGLRAAANLHRNDFIYEYIGEVVTENTLMRRMRAYNDEGIKHFYFMMLQKGEFIDATKRGGIGRFANHSCNPNCYVAKWVVGNRIRMAIFAKRNIVKDEELTFNYNVDRYGNDAQVCHCGEAKCVGFIGGKTQTEVATMDDVYLDALGLDEDEIRALSINVPKKVKKGKKAAAATTNSEEEELNFAVKPLQVQQVAALLIAIRKAIGTTRPMLVKLLSRLQITDDLPSLRQFLRLRGLGLLAEIVCDLADDIEVVVIILRSIQVLPMTNRIKIEDVGFEDKIKPFTESEDESLKSLANQVLEKWSQLEQGFRIPRRKLDDDDVPTITHITLGDDEADRPRKRPRITVDYDIPLDLPPVRKPSSIFSQSTRTPDVPTPPPPPAWTAPTQSQLDAIIARAAATAAAMAVPPPSSTAKDKSKHRSSDKSKSRNTEALKEKQLKKLIGGMVVKSTSKYAKQLGHDTFKKFAEECTVAIAEKEKKSSSYATAKLDKFSDEKQAKIKKFARDFFTKAVHKVEKKKASRAPSSSSPVKASSSSNSTMDPRRVSMSTTPSSSSVTLDGLMTASPSATAQGSQQEDGEDISVEELMNDMFGGDDKFEDEDEEETLKAEETPDGDMDVDGDQLKTGTLENTPVGEDMLDDQQNFKIEQDSDVVAMAQVT